MWPDRRTEKRILKSAAPTIVSDLEKVDVIEMGSGDCSKISLLFDAMPDTVLPTIRYIPVDVSHSAIDRSAHTLLERFPELHIHGVVADFLSQMHHIPARPKRLFCFFGSTIGNLTRDQGLTFCAKLAAFMNPGDSLLLGLDMVKSLDVLEPAYNDARNVTEKFNRNILQVVNSIAGTNFNPLRFRHLAFYNTDEDRMEMYLEADSNMQVISSYNGRRIHIRNRERIHTENSHKYSQTHIREISDTSGLKEADLFTDENHWFSLVRFVKPAS